MLVTTGVAAALFIVATALLEPGDDLVVVRPNYATNLETPWAIGAEPDFLDLRSTKAGPPTRTPAGADDAPETPRSITTPHNPTGAVMPEAALREVVALAEERQAVICWSMRPIGISALDPPLPTAQLSLSPRAISVSSLSKAYGLPGIRIGWLTTRDADLLTTFLAAKEQIQITGSLVDEAIAARALERRPELLPAIRAQIAAALETTRAWLAAEPRLAWVEPGGGVVGFPWIRDEAGIEPDAFHAVLAGRHATAVGPGHWFERPRSFFRLGFGWPPPAELAEGLARISRALDDATLG